MVHTRISRTVDLAAMMEMRLAHCWSTIYRSMSTGILREWYIEVTVDHPFSEINEIAGLPSRVLRGTSRKAFYHVETYTDFNSFVSGKSSLKRLHLLQVLHDFGDDMSQVYSKVRTRIEGF